MSVGIDYGMGKTNVNLETGIRYGVIAQNSIMPEALDDMEQDYGEPTCPECGEPAIDSSDDSIKDEEWNEGKDYACKHCKQVYWSDAVYSEESLGFSYDKDGYKLINCLDADVMIIESPYYTFAKFCSPCVPGAGDLNNTTPDGVKTYCLGHDWYDGGRAPYTVYSVKDQSEVIV